MFKETIMDGHDGHNTTILSIKHNISTTCIGQYYFWPSSGWIQLSEKTTQYIIRYSMTTSVGVSRGGRDHVYKRVGGRVCRRFNTSARYKKISHPHHTTSVAGSRNAGNLWCLHSH